MAAIAAFLRISTIEAWFGAAETPSTRLKETREPGEGVDSEIPMTVWYRFLLVAWALTVIPIALLAYGFSGGHISSFPDTSGFTAGQYVELILDLVWLLAPLLLAPFGFRRWRRKHPR